MEITAPSEDNRPGGTCVAPEHATGCQKLSRHGRCTTAPLIAPLAPPTPTRGVFSARGGYKVSARKKAPRDVGVGRAKRGPRRPNISCDLSSAAIDASCSSSPFHACLHSGIRSSVVFLYSLRGSESRKTRSRIPGSLILSFPWSANKPCVRSFSCSRDSVYVCVVMQGEKLRVRRPIPL